MDVQIAAQRHKPLGCYLRAYHVPAPLSWFQARPGPKLQPAFPSQMARKSLYGTVTRRSARERSGPGDAILFFRGGRLGGRPPRRHTNGRLPACDEAVAEADARARTEVGGCERIDAAAGARRERGIHPTRPRRGRASKTGALGLSGRSGVHPAGSRAKVENLVWVGPGA